ncbi:MAG: hypothetical protein LBS31_08435 [Candidatus Adiutrix sp.]|jgi:hypothetical protein|nr:hypothetical protein [Candidatus Adiutrix sp.]
MNCADAWQMPREALSRHIAVNGQAASLAGPIWIADLMSHGAGWLSLEYNREVSAVFQAVRRDMGLDDPGAEGYYGDMIADPDLSEEVRLEVKRRLAVNARVRGLARRLGDELRLGRDWNLTADFTWG